MAWAWVRPRDQGLLAARPLLDLGCGDGQTLRALVRPGGLVVGLDRSPVTLRAARRTLDRPLAAADARHLPVRDGAAQVVLAADLLHHQDDIDLGVVLGEARRVLVAGGRLVAWWYGSHGRPAPDAPRFPRTYGQVEEAARTAGFSETAPLDLEAPKAGPATVGLVAVA